MNSRLKINLLIFLCSNVFLFSQPLIKFSSWQHRFSSNEEWKSGNPKIISLVGESDYDTLLDPLKGYGLKTAAAWEKRDWQVRSFFKTGNFNKETHFNLFLSGLTPYARVYLNNTFLFESDNYFKAYNYAIEKLIKLDGTNELRIDLPSPTLRAELEFKKDAINYPSDNEESNKKVSQFLRMPPMCFGWDICPRLLPDRLPKEIFISRWDKIKIEDLSVTTDSISSNKAYLKLEAEIKSDFTGPGEIELAITDGNNTVFTKTETIPLKKGKNNFEKNIALQEAKFWFPNGFNGSGFEEPFLYKVRCKISSGNIQTIKEENFGVRKINLIREKDVFGENFYLKVNGEKIFIKGANYVPDLLDFQRNNPTKKFKEIILKAKDVGFNMIRVWGGGNYLSEEQLHICDEAGIMVWQDFIFSGTMYPGNEKFLKNVQEEAISQVKAYRKHPCLALWCGNNEIEVAWKNWGWQEKYKIHGKDSIRLWKAYKKIFNEILPNTILKYDPGTRYISSSPLSNWGKEEDFLSGDNHYWGVWHGEFPLESFEKKIPRFMSEYGLPSFPSKEIIEKYFSYKKFDLKDSAIQSRMRSYKGIRLMEKYAEQEYGKVPDLQSLLIYSQSMQADAYGKAIRSHRFSKPFCMGTLFWQLNEAWPGISWSALDYELNEKPVWREIKKYYQPIILWLETERNEIVIKGVSDLYRDTTITLRLEVKSKSGHQISDTTLQASLKSNSSTLLFSVSQNLLFKNNRLEDVELFLWDEKKYLMDKLSKDHLK